MRFPIKIGLQGSNHLLWEGFKNGVIRDPISGSWWWRQRVRRTDLTLPAATNGTFIFEDVFPNNPFPQRVIRKHLLVYVTDSLVGPSISNGTLIVGDTNDPNGLLESTAGDIFGNDDAVLQHLAAAEAAYRYEADFAAAEFSFRLDSTGANLSVATALDLTFLLEFAPTLYRP